MAGVRRGLRETADRVCYVLRPQPASLCQRPSFYEFRYDRPTSHRRYTALGTEANLGYATVFDL